MNDCLGLKMNDEEIKELMEEVDTNKNGQIDFRLKIFISFKSF